VCSENGWQPHVLLKESLLGGVGEYGDLYTQEMKKIFLKKKIRLPSEGGRWETGGAKGCAVSRPGEIK